MNNIKKAIEVLIKAASLGEYSELEKMIVDEAILVCSQIQFQEPKKEENYENDEQESSKEENLEEKEEEKS